MTTPEPAGFLMRRTWRADAVLARRFEQAAGIYAPGRIRAAVGAMLAGRVGGEVLSDVVVLVSELVTNAVRHGAAGERQTIIVHVALAPDVLRVEVCDQGPGFEPPLEPRGRPAGGGNGLVLLSRMASSWGVDGDDGTCVWFERALEAA